MGLMSSRNLKKAKAMVEKNRHKVGGLVDKATDQVDKVSKGKTSNVTAKIDQAAHKFSGDEVIDEAIAPKNDADAEPTDKSNDEPSDSESAS